MNIKHAALALVVGLAACAAPSQPYLDNARTMCTSGHPDFCSQIPDLQARVNVEQNEQAKGVALGVLGILGAVAIGAAAAYGASQPTYTDVVVVCRWRC
jgi:hypothetical protein